MIPTKISAGDPVTSDLISNMIININTLAAPPTTTTINLSNAGANTPAAAISTTVLALPGSKTVKAADKGGTQYPVPFKHTFVGTPSVWVQINTIGQGSVSWPDSQIFPQVESVSSTAASIRFRTNTANSSIKFTVFVAGTLATA
jgi:hypothetical protein